MKKRGSPTYSGMSDSRSRGAVLSRQAPSSRRVSPLLPCRARPRPPKAASSIRARRNRMAASSSKARTIITMDEKLGDIAKGDLLIEGKKIVAVGGELKSAGAQVIDGIECDPHSGLRRLPSPFLGRPASPHQSQCRDPRRLLRRDASLLRQGLSARRHVCRQSHHRARLHRFRHHLHHRQFAQFAQRARIPTRRSRRCSTAASAAFMPPAGRKPAIGTINCRRIWRGCRSNSSPRPISS